MKTMKCPYCGKEMVKHIIKEGARFHVHNYHGTENGALVTCSTKDCEDNHGPGHCVPMKKSSCDACGIPKYLRKCGKCMAERTIKRIKKRLEREENNVTI